MERAKRLGAILLEVVWAAVFILMPITSFPLLSRLTGGTSVAPAALLPLGLIGLFWFLPYLFKGGRLPRESLPFLLFISVAVVAGAAAFFLDLPPFKDAGVLHEEITAFVTLAIGAAFYLLVACWHAGSEVRLRRALQWINLSGVFITLWAALQAVYIFLYNSHYPGLLLKFQSLVSTRDLFIGRITSFAFEPSWLAHQLNLLYIPLWLGASVAGYSAFRFRLGKITVENVLLVFGAGMVLLASRVGTLAILLLLVFLGLYGNLILARRWYRWTQRRFAGYPPAVTNTLRLLLPVLLLIVFAAAYVAGAVVLVYGLSHVDARLARFFMPTSLQQWRLILQDPYYFFNFLAFAERVVYWVGGWGVFNLHPFLGVGLGNAGFYFQKLLPAYSWSLPEVMDVYYRASGLPNIKSLWVRLLAETGVTGFSAFLAWFYVLARSSWQTRSSRSALIKTFGWAGVFTLLAFVVEGFSIDTFALPYLWTCLGFASAAALLLRANPGSPAGTPEAPAGKPSLSSGAAPAKKAGRTTRSRR